ncbi:hypothetical protein [Chryseobacterium sp.]|uniref:hypothetical protein n=1 Tax=Chryseobacterium sp. TaxID=1871047 RepID=UPI000EC4534B|nr:hypothetical protein [Chryseobacterium sp.]HCA09343.1 hypothetical protein [Chryseobacterium sp.]
MFFIFSFSQKKKKKTKDALAELRSYSYNDGEIKKDFKPIPLQKRIARFPFGKASKIKIISYNLYLKKARAYEPAPPPPKTKLDSVNLEKYYENLKNTEPVELGDVINNTDNEGLQESKMLTLNEISELTHILYNTCNKYYISLISQSGCFFPRNAILFYDENDKVFAYYDICFECEGIESSPKGMLEPIETCEFLYPDLEKFFKSKGLTTQYMPKK